MKKFQKVFLKIISAIFLILVLSSMMVCAKASERFTLRVGYWADYSIKEDAKGRLSGYTYDYMKEIARRNGWNVTFISCNWNEGRELLAKGEIDVFGPMEKTDKREQIYDYPERSMGEEGGILYVRADNDSIFYEDPQSMNGKIIGTMEENYFLQDLKEYCDSNQITLQVKSSSDSEELQRELQNGSIDLLAVGSMQLQEDAKVVKRFEAQPFYYPTTKGNTVVLDGINRANQAIQQENIYYNPALYHKYYQETSAEKIAFTQEEAAFLKSAPQVVVGYQKGREPYVYLDPTNQRVQGIMVDLLEEVTKFSGLQFTYIPISDKNSYEQKIKSRQLDMVAGIVVDENTERVYELQPTDTMIDSTLVYITRPGKQLKQENCTIAIPKEWIGIKNQMMRNYPMIKVKSYGTMKECLEAVRKKKVDAAVQNILSADKVLKPLQYQNLVVHNMNQENVSFGLGMSQEDSPLLLSILNKSIRAIDESAMDQTIYKHTIGTPYNPSFLERIIWNAPILMFSAFLFLIIIFIVSSISRRKLNQLAYYDSLTGEMNINKFKEETQKLMHKANKICAIMVIDIDKFKSINNFYGYEFGDQMLKLIAQALHAHSTSDTIICRGSADKFYLFFEYIDSIKMKEQFDIYVNAIEESIRIHMSSCKIILSAGVSIIQEEDQNISIIVDRANIASKQVKNYHVSSYELYDPSMYDSINQARTIENDMSAALEREEFIIYLQPKIELTTNRIMGAEALVRWNNPEKGLMFPNDFIPLFEQNGFIVKLDFYVLEQVCKLLVRWKEEKKKLFTISVNLSRRHLLCADTVEKIHEIVMKYDVEPRFIEVELTESAFDNCNIPSIQKLFDELHAFGFTVSVDDFGAGYSSLSLLKDLPIDVLKIDKSFFGGDQNYISEKMGILLESVISLSRRLCIKTVSEGVETKQQVAMLVALGCDLVQGYYFARPMPIDKLEERLAMGEIFES